MLSAFLAAGKSSFKGQALDMPAALSYDGLLAHLQENSDRSRYLLALLTVMQQRGAAVAEVMSILTAQAGNGLRGRARSHLHSQRARSS